MPPQEEPQAREVSTGGVAMAVVETGAANLRPLLLVHGFTGAKEDFGDWMGPLAERGWHAVAADLRGHAASAHPDGEESYSLATFAADIVSLADALGWDRFVVLGHSMGGMVAQLVALDHPDRLTGLVLMDTTHGPVDWVDPELFAMARSVVRQEGMATLLEIQKAQRETDPLTTPAFLRLLHERPGYGDFCDRKFMASAQDMWLAMGAEMQSQPDRLERLAKLDLPTLVIVGEQDAPFVPNAERMAKAIPGARLAVVPDAGHSPQFEGPDRWWEALTSFLDDLDCSAP